MENNELINESVLKLTKKKVIKIKEIPEFPLCKSEEEGKALLIDTIRTVDLSIKEFKWLPEYDKVVQWMVNPNHKGLQLVGEPGRLKTVIATLVMPVLYYAVYKFIIRPVEAADIEQSYAIFNQSPVIIVDDIGTEFTINDYGIKREPVNTLIDFCEKKSKVLIMTSNFSSELINTRYGIRTTDRLDLLCNAVWFKGESMR